MKVQADDKLTLSGGEPTLHPDFLAVVDEVRRPEVGIVSVSTNGLRLAEDEDLIRALRDRDEHAPKSPAADLR